jgi:hypothetical protein
MALPTAKYRGLIEQKTLQQQLPLWMYQGEVWPAYVWFEGLVLQESSGDPNARRYEKHQDKPGDPDTPGVDDGSMEDDASYGLCQIMGTTAKWLLKLNPQKPMSMVWLYDPDINLMLGARLLAKLLPDVGMDVARALCRYNGGGTGDKIINGVYRRQEYVDLVAKRTRQVDQDIKNWTREGV